MNVLIAGASGLVGGELLRLLLADPRVTSVQAVVRRMLPLNHSKLKQLVLDLSDLERARVEPSEVAFCCLGTTIKQAGSKAGFRRVDHECILNFARLAKRFGCGKFLLVSALGANPSSRVFYNRVKGETERDLAAVGFSQLVMVRPSLLLGERSEKRFAESLAIQLYPFYRPLLRGPLAAQMPIHAKRVAESLQKLAFTENRGLLVVSNKEMLAGS